MTWTSSVVVHSQDDANESIGVYGIEGSKTGAAAVGAYLSHQVIGLNYLRYGALLREATFTCTKVGNPHLLLSSDFRANLI